MLPDSVIVALMVTFMLLAALMVHLYSKDQRTPEQASEERMVERYNAARTEHELQGNTRSFPQYIEWLTMTEGDYQI